jgi:hypothetical protein
MSSDILPATPPTVAPATDDAISTLQLSKSIIAYSHSFIFESGLAQRVKEAFESGN